MRLKHILKPTVAEVSPTATSETCNPTRLKVVKTSKIAVFYNFYRFRVGLAPPLKSPSNANTSLQNSILPIFDFSEPVFCAILSKKI